jgi:hypothetical protein
MKTLNKKDILLDGNYLITDPCYIYEDDWNLFCDLLWDGENNNNGITVFEIDGKEVPVMSTKYGDGYYPVYDKNFEVGGFPVDAGLFAVIPWKDKDSNDGPVLTLKGKLTYKDGNAYLNGELLVTTCDQDEIDYD